MIFNSHFFIFIFLPITLIGFYSIGKRGHHLIAISWLVGMSLLFYAWWNPVYLGLLLCSILFNYAVGIALNSDDLAVSKKLILIFGISVNLALLGYFKYANFFIDQLNILIGSDFNIERILLPLAISFFTFQQIAYLVDAYNKETKEYKFLHYCLFVTFFPQLIAGPIVHHKEMLPQFSKDNAYRFNYENISVGFTIFAIGLFKKVIIADGIAKHATIVFTNAELGIDISFFAAWSGALAYTFQIYFDFSGYSDMAIGLARMFAIRLPLNFHSPYKAYNIIEFWRRWHMTLSRFLRDYLYIPLGGNRKGPMRRYVNLMLTMVLGGFWHGAGWTFIVWGALHGFYLVLNHGWHALRRSVGQEFARSSFWGRISGVFITFVLVVIAWVFFRADSLDGALNIIYAMFGGNGISPPEKYQPGRFISAALLVWLAPNTQQIMIRFKPAFETYRGEMKSWNKQRFQWQPTLRHAFLIIFIFYYSIINLINESEFLYFNF